MAITIKCADCGHTEESKDGEPETCPQCEGAMAPPPKKKYQAKSSSLEDEERSKKKGKRRDDDDDDDERPRAKKKKAAAMSLDDDADDEKGDSTRSGKAAAHLGLRTGFKNRALMRQVAGELSRGEVLNFACRPCAKIAKMQGLLMSAFGALFAVIGVVVLVAFATGAAKNMPAFAYAVPVAFILIGGIIAVVAPIAKVRQAKHGWYAVTDRRALVFTASLWGKSGHTETYGPSALRRMWVKKSFWVKGAGDLVFKTETTHHTRTERDHTTGRTRTSTSTSTQYFGFLGVEDVKDVETLVHEVLLTRKRDDDDDD